MFHDLSEEHAQNILVCLPQDLYTLYVYWDFTGLRNQIVTDFLQRVKPEYRLNVRLCRLDPENGQFGAWRELSLQHITNGNYYFRNLNPIDTYCCELGAKNPAGDFICFYQTLPVRMQPVDEIDRLAAIEAKTYLHNHDNLVERESLVELERNQQLIAMSSWG